MIARLGRLRAALPAPGWMALALAAGFAIGLAAGPAYVGAIAVAQLLGNLFIDALRMTILPLIFALVVTSVATLAGGRDEAGSAQLGWKLPAIMIGLLLMACTVAVLLAPALFALHPAPAGIAVALGGPAAAAPAEPLSWPDTIRGFVPTNVFASAAQGALIPLVIFATVLGLALARLPKDRAEPTLAPLRGLADAMILVVGWVLRAAPLGIFALGFSIGATAGADAIAPLGLYILVQAAVSLTIIVLLYAIVRTGGVPLGRFARAMLPAQAVAAGTQSSIASLPAMLVSAGRLGLRESDAGVALSFSVAVFKVTAGSGTIVSALGMAWLAGVEVTPAQLLAAFPLAMLATLTVLGVPGPGSIIAATTPVAIALGVPMELLPIILAVDVIPDMFRTTANVTADVTVAALVAQPASAADEALD